MISICETFSTHISRKNYHLIRAKFKQRRNQVHSHHKVKVQDNRIKVCKFQSFFIIHLKTDPFQYFETFFHILSKGNVMNLDRKTCNQSL